MLDWQEMAQELSGGAEIKEGGDAAEALESLSAEIDASPNSSKKRKPTCSFFRRDHADAYRNPRRRGRHGGRTGQVSAHVPALGGLARFFVELDFLPGDEAGIKSVSLRIRRERMASKGAASTASSVFLLTLRDAATSLPRWM